MNRINYNLAPSMQISHIFLGLGFVLVLVLALTSFSICHMLLLLPLFAIDSDLVCTTGIDTF